MRILAIETSCDETAVAIVEDGNKVRSSVVASSAEMHAKTGGIIPEEAARQQIKAVLPVMEEALSKAGYKKESVDALAVTVGPGLIGSLLVGVETAKTLARLWGKPIVPVNHMMGHVYACWLGTSSPPLFPALTLVVSGGHTDLVLMKNHGKVRVVGGTRDDAAGEAFDKSARLLGLPYPGGPSISRAAAKFGGGKVEGGLALFPRPMIDEDNFDWSFSGLKTAVLNETRNKKMNSGAVKKYAAEVQEAICEVLVTKSMRAVEKYQPRSFLLTGGVAANRKLREMFEERFRTQTQRIALHVPETMYCTNNAA